MRAQAAQPVRSSKRLARDREIREVRTRVAPDVQDIAISSGCSEAWYRAWFGTRRPWVQIPPARREPTDGARIAVAAATGRGFKSHQPDVNYRRSKNVLLLCIGQPKNRKTLRRFLREFD